MLSRGIGKSVKTELNRGIRLRLSEQKRLKLVVDMNSTVRVKTSIKLRLRLIGLCLKDLLLLVLRNLLRIQNAMV